MTVVPIALRERIRQARTTLRFLRANIDERITPDVRCGLFEAEMQLNGLGSVRACRAILLDAAGCMRSKGQDDLADLVATVHCAVCAIDDGIDEANN